MLNDILVALEKDSGAFVEYAISLARLLDARVTVVSAQRGAWMRADGLSNARAEFAPDDSGAGEVGASECLERFGAKASAAGVDVEIVWPDDPQNPGRDQLGVFARAFDLGVVGQPEPGRAPGFDDLSRNLLAESGRPLLVTPAIQRPPASCRCVVVGWDGSAAAARAFGDASPIFARANSVEIVCVTIAATSPAVEASGERLAERLARDGVKATFRRLPSDEDSGNALLSYAADVGADLMVAGGYGHSPLREGLFGGVTRTLLSSQTLPLFLSR